MNLSTAIATPLLFFILFTQAVIAQDTFSICAVDAATGQVGSAGATCITSSSISAIIISDVHPGVGVVHTQAYWNAVNQNYARSLMSLGSLSPQMIIDSLTAHDVQGNNTIRQYGIVDLAVGGRSASYTGVNCNNYKNHITGPGFAIQGNILLGQQVLDSMQSRFLNTPGTLACRLMAALQGAKVTGADTRCAPYGISSFSAFIRVANPADSVHSLFLDISINTYPSSIDPIDSLQTLFNSWGGCTALYIPSMDEKKGLKIFPNPVADKLIINVGDFSGTIEMINLPGCILQSLSVVNQKEVTLDVSSRAKGIYFLKLTSTKGDSYAYRFVKF